MALWRKLLFSFGLAIGLLLFIRQAWLSYEAVQIQDFSLIRPSFLVAALGSSLLMYFVQMGAWLVIMRYLGVALRLRQTVQGYSLSFLPRYIPGSVWGYWSRSEWLQQSHGVSYTTSVMGSVLEALGILLTGLLVSGVYLTAELEGYLQLVVGLVCLALLVATFLILPRLATKVGQRLMRGKGRIAWSEAPSLATWSAVVVMYLLLWVIFGGSLLFTAGAMMPLSIRDLPGTIFAASLSWILGFVIVFVPAGLGVRELAVSTLLASHPGMLPWQADLVAVLSRFGLIVAELAWLLVGLALLALSRRE